MFRLYLTLLCNFEIRFCTDFRVKQIYPESNQEWFRFLCVIRIIKYLKVNHMNWQWKATEKVTSLLRALSFSVNKP